MLWHISTICFGSRGQARDPAGASILYIVAIAWLYVTLMMALTEKNLVAGALTFGFYGLAPCALLLWLLGTPARHRARARKSRQAAASAEAPPATLVDQPVDQNDGDDTQRH
ncbi:MAG TPA: hypothetical protein VF928_06175 [Usitatibacteraceae bacterium]